MNEMSVDVIRYHWRESPSRKRSLFVVEGKESPRNESMSENAKTAQNLHVVFIHLFPPYQIEYDREIKAFEQPAILRHGERLAVHMRRMNFS